MTSMDDLVAFLRARLDEDEADASESVRGPWQARERSGGGWIVTGRTDPHLVATFDDYGFDRRTPYHIARHDPARVLAEVTAKRQIVQLHEGGGHECAVFDRHGAIDYCYYVLEGDACSTLRLLAMSYVNHPHYQEAWKPWMT